MGHSSSTEPLPFRFDAEDHTYWALDTGERLPSITTMIKAAGLIDTTWFTDEHRHRGEVVHKMTADYDLGALTPDDVPHSKYRGYLLAHVKAMSVIPHAWQAVEEARAHRELRFAGRTDRAGKVFNLSSVLDIKTGVPAAWHQIQTALQAILEADALNLPPTALARFTLYLGDSGRFKLEQHVDGEDYHRAMALIRRHAR